MGGGLMMKGEEDVAAVGVGAAKVTEVIMLLAFTFRPFAPSMCSTGGTSPQTTMPLSSGKFCAEKRFMCRTDRGRIQAKNLK
jgi:hypothetical protein